jgi:hypothetical protein
MSKLKSNIQNYKYISPLVEDHDAQHPVDGKMQQHSVFVSG